MRNFLFKMLMITSTVLTLFLFSNFVVMADNQNETIILQKTEDEYIIYYKNICDSEFQYALSINSEEVEEDLTFINSVKDKDTEKALNVIFFKKSAFMGQEKENYIYIWIKDIEGNTIIKADKIDLTNSITDEMIELVDSTTKRIDVDTTQKNETTQNINGVKTSITVGKVVIKENANSKYYYKLIKADEENPKEKEFFELAETIQKGTDNTYESLTQSKKFYKLYNELMPKEEEWKKVENSEILQPETTRNGDKYIVWLKESNDGKDIIDAKFLISVYEYKPEYEKDDKIIQTPVKSPVTYDNPALIIIFVIVIVAIISLIILKAKTTKKSKH